MKKFISMVMAAAMVVSLVPATAFAANTASFKVTGDLEFTEKTVVENQAINGPQIQIKLNDVDTVVGEPDTFDLKLHFDNAELKELPAQTWGDAKVVRTYDGVKTTVGTVSFEKTKAEADVLKVTVTEKEDFRDGDIIVLELAAGAVYMTKTSEGTQATVKVTGDFGTSDEMVIASVLSKGIEVEVDDTVDVAEEEVATLEEITVEPSVKDTTFAAVAADNDKIVLKLNKGFEFANNDTDKFTFTYDTGKSVNLGAAYVDENEIEIDEIGSWVTEAGKIEITGLKVEATNAKAGDVAVLSVKVGDSDWVKVEVATVCDYTVVMSVDEDEDVPVYYSGVNQYNDGLTVDDDHESLEVTIEETFVGAWSNHKEFTLSLPEGVYVVENGVDVDAEGSMKGCDNLTKAFENAYIEGDHVTFEFEKRTFAETKDSDNDKENEMVFTLTLVADPGFVGDVVLTLEGDAVETQEVVIAKFVAPATVKAEQNDLKIDYRYTEVGTDIVVTEAEAGLWEEGLKIGFQVDRGDMINFEDDATFTVNEESDMEVEDFTYERSGVLGFVVEEESDEEAAVVTISDIELFMQRNIPAGPYDLDMYYGLVATAADDADGLMGIYDETVLLGQKSCNHDDCDSDNGGKNVEDICDYSKTVKEAWINVVTAGREADDASFTTKVVVPVGEAYIIAGETQVALDVPAYVNAAGYTMLPVRAVAVALGINTQNVLWDQATKTVTILYGQRIITMQVGAKVVYVNGSAIPASASVEIVDGRTFLPMRDLATALGVTDITWDAATKTATLNGNA